MSDQFELPVAEFTQVQEIIFGALERIPQNRRGKESLKYQSAIEDTPYIVSSYEAKMTASDLSMEAQHARRHDDVYRLPGVVERSSEGIKHHLSARINPRYRGIVTVALHGMRETKTDVFYTLRRQESGLVTAAHAAFGAISDPEEFATIVDSADYSKPAGILSELTDTENQELETRHAPLINRINHLIGRDGISFTDEHGDHPDFIPVRTASYTFGDEVIRLSRSLDKRESLLVTHNYQNLDGDEVQEVFINASNIGDDANYLTILSLLVNKQPIQRDSYSGANAMSQATVDHLAELLNQV